MACISLLPECQSPSSNCIAYFPDLPRRAGVYTLGGHLVTSPNIKLSPGPWHTLQGSALPAVSAQPPLWNVLDNRQCAKLTTGFKTWTGFKSKPQQPGCCKLLPQLQGPFSSSVKMRVMGHAGGSESHMSSCMEGACPSTGHSISAP